MLIPEFDPVKTMPPYNRKQRRGGMDVADMFRSVDGEV